MSRRQQGRRPAARSRRTIDVPPPATPAGATADWLSSPIVISLALIALVLVIFEPVRTFGFVQLDDAEYVSANPHLSGGLTWTAIEWAFTSGRASNWHPVTWISYLLDVSLFGVRAGAMHVINVLCHAANTVLLFLVLRRMTGATGRSAAVAALFAAHPLHVESVAWIAERKDVLSTCFGFLTLAAYAEYVAKPGWQRYVLVLAWFAIGLMAKPMLVTLPFVLLLLDVWPLGRLSASTVRALLVEKIPLLALAAGSSAMTFMAQQQGGAVRTLEALPLGLRAENAIVHTVVYLAQAVWPSHLSVFYPHPVSFALTEVAGAAAVLAGLTALAVWLRQRAPYVLVGWLWYVGMLVPVIGLIQVGRQAGADRYTYLPLVGVFIAIVWSVSDLLSRADARRILRPAIAAVIVLVCVVTARAQVDHWRNNARLWSSALTSTLRIDDRRADEAVAALTHPDGQVDPQVANYFRLTPAEAHQLLGQALNRAGDIDGAVASLREAVALDPTRGSAHSDLGRMLGAHHHLEEAVAEFKAAEQLEPNSADVHRDLGLAYATEERWSEAIDEYQAALRLRPGDAQVESNLGSALGAAGRITEALPHLAEAVRLNPNFGDAHRNYGLALAAAGRTAEAVREFRDALRVNPNDQQARRALDALAGGSR